VVNPLLCVSSVILTPETGGLVCQFQHPTVFDIRFERTVIRVTTIQNNKKTAIAFNK